MKGCLAWLGAMALVGVLASMVLVGIGMAAFADTATWRWAGTGLVAAAGVLTIVAAKSGRFARAMAATLAPVETGLETVGRAIDGEDASVALGDDPFHGRTGRHSIPTAVGIGILLSAAIMAAAILVS